jgi:hypothetical protein
MEGIFINNSKLNKYVFCVVNSKKKYIRAPAESLLESKLSNKAMIV